VEGCDPRACARAALTALGLQGGHGGPRQPPRRAEAVAMGQRAIRPGTAGDTGAPGQSAAAGSSVHGITGRRVWAMQPACSASYSAAATRSRSSPMPAVATRRAGGCGRSAGRPLCARPRPRSSRPRLQRRAPERPARERHHVAGGRGSQQELLWIRCGRGAPEGAPGPRSWRTGFPRGRSCPGQDLRTRSRARRHGPDLVAFVAWTWLHRKALHEALPRTPEERSRRWGR